MNDEAFLSAAVAAAQAQQAASLPQYSLPGTIHGTKYQQLVQVIEEIGKDVRPTYTGNKICQERLKRSIVHARLLVRECTVELEKERSAQTTKALADAAASDREKEKEKEQKEKEKDLKKEDLTLPLKPAFLRFSPSSHLLVSTYQLSSPSSRQGSLILFPSPSSSLSSHKTIPTSGGVFRFLLHNSQLLATLTTGSLALLSLDNFDVDNVVEVSVCQSMLLDVSWKGEKAVVSSNDGQLFLVDLHSNKSLSSCTAHKLPWTEESCEVWTCDYWDESVVCSGGEDCTVRLWDTRGGLDSAVGVIKGFDAGVTFTQFIDDHSLLTGSYDSFIRLFDIRQPKRTVEETETNGGVWHMEENELGWMASCMYGGWMLVDRHLIPQAQSQSAGSTLLYGSALSPDLTVLARCTFNDSTLSVDLLPPNLSWSQLFPLSTS